jgi:hypothetical protein
LGQRGYLTDDLVDVVIEASSQDTARLYPPLRPPNILIPQLTVRMWP